MTVERVYLKSGEMYVGKKSEEIFTTLGTCIAFCVFDKKKKIGGMIHYLLPNMEAAGEFDASSTADVKNPLNYGATAIPMLFKEFKKSGSNKGDLQIVIIGGNSVGATDISKEIVKQNTEVAIDWAKNLGIPYVLHPSRGETGQQILFQTASGELLIKKSVGNSKIQSKPTKKEAKSRMDSNPKIAVIEVPEVKVNNFAFRKIRVLIVDDSNPIRQILKKILSDCKEIEVVGEAADAAEGEKLRIERRPDVMTLDIHMPNKDGVTYLSELMRDNPMPVIMVSDLSMKEAGPVMKALEIGAFDYLQKPGLRELAEVGPRLISTIRAAFDGRNKIITMHLHRAAAPKNQVEITQKVEGYDSRLKLIAIGASTGGTEALRAVFKALPAQTPPIVVVQHMPKQFTGAFAQSLNLQAAIEVKEAEHGDILKNNTGYIAPGGMQLGIHDKGNGMQIYLKDDPPLNRFKPSVDYMFNSIVQLSLKTKVTAALLTGMGEDGARGLLGLRSDGSHTIAQDENTCVVYGMPKAAVDRNAAVEILPLDSIAYSLLHSGSRINKKVA